MAEVFTHWEIRWIYVYSSRNISICTQFCSQFQGSKEQKPILDLFGGEGSGAESKTLCLIALKENYFKMLILKINGLSR